MSRNSQSGGFGGDLGRRGLPPLMPLLNKGLGLILVLGLLLWFSTGVYTLPAGTHAVVSQSGRISVVTDPGWHFANPWGFAGSDVVRVPMNRPYSLEFGFRTEVQGADGKAAKYREVPEEAENLTKDGFYIHSEAVINLLPTDPFKWVYNARNRDVLVRQVAASAMLRGFAERTLEVGLTSKAQEEVQANVRADLDAFMKTVDLGAKVQSVNLQNVKAPASVTDAYNKVANAKSQAEADIKAAEAKYNTDVANANAEATAKLAEADKFYSETIGSANGAAQEFAAWYAQYRTNPDLANKRLYWEALQKLITRKGIQIYLMREDGSTVRYLPMN